MRLSSLTIWYNPSLKEVKNILSYSDNFDKVYIVDNSDLDNSELAKKINNAVYVPLMKNTGIAYALNRGFERAISDGFDWVMTMDQDSVWEDEEIKKYLQWAEQITIENNNIVSLAPFAKVKNKSWAGVLLWPLVLKLTKRKGIDFVDRCFCSSNIVSVNAWQVLSGFNEKLFIDDVDYDFCYRLRRKGYLIVLNNDIWFNHAIGGGKLTILPRRNNHSDFRLYYIMRNMMYIIKVYPEFAKKFKYRKELFLLIVDTCLFNKEHRKILARAKHDLKTLL